MKKIAVILLVLVTAVLVWQCKSAQESSEVTTIQLIEFVKDWEVALKEKQPEKIKSYYLRDYIFPPVSAFGKEITYEFDESALQVSPMDQGLYNVVIPYEIKSAPTYGVKRDGNIKLTITLDDLRQLKIAQEIGTFDKHLWEVAKEVEVKAEEIRKAHEARLAQEAVTLTDDTYPEVIKRLQEEYDHVLFYTQVDSTVLFWVCNGKWQYSYLFTWADEKQPVSTKMGVVDSTGKVIVPVEYKTVYNPSGTVPNMIVAEKGGFKDLFDYSGNKILEYSASEIYPSYTEGVLAHLQSGSAFGLLYEEGYRSEFPSARTSLEPRWVNPIKDLPSEAWNFDISAPGTVYLVEPGDNTGQYDPVEGRGCIFTPSYLYRLGIHPRAYPGIITPTMKNADFGLDKSYSKVKVKKESESGFITFVSDFMEEGLDARGYVYEATKLSTINSIGDTLGTLELNWPESWVNCGNLEYSFLGDTLEVITSGGGKPVSKYSQFPRRSYYILDEKGQFKELGSFRDFSMTQFREITPKDFEGCFAQPLDEGDYGQVLISNHLTNEDLDIMRNEIFAQYGYRFKKKKWMDYFKAKEGYQAAYDNVDHLLTPLDKKNIQTILDFQKEFKKIEAEVIQVDTSYYAAAG